MQKKLIAAGTLFFLLGVAFLVIRNNSYPWPVKRASDIFFLLAGVCTIPLFVRERKKVAPGLKKPFVGFSVMLIGTVIGTIYGSCNAIPLNNAGLLEFLRIFETGLILFTAGTLAFYNSSLPRKTAYAQLSTLLYLSVFFNLSFFANYMYRFQLFENFPSNVGYYLIVSIILLFLMLLKNVEKKSWNTLLIFALATGLTAVLLWTQSRASWVGVFAALLISLVLLGNRWRFRMWALSFGLGAAITVFAIFILPRTVRNDIIFRVFPSFADIQTPTSASNLKRGKTIDLLKTIEAQKLVPQFSDPSRLYLWKEFGKEALHLPLGQGVNFSPLIYEGEPKGPHNTILEWWMKGGIIAVAGFLYLVFLSFQRLKKSLNVARSIGNIYLIASLTGLLIASLFDNMGTFRLLWIILALGIFYPSENKEHSELRSS